MIVIKNRQRTVPIDVNRLYREVALIIALLGYEQYDITVVITNNRTIRRFNRDFRSVDTVTDILSFPYYADVIAGDRIIPSSDEEHILGDIVISAPYVASAAREHGVPFTDRMRMLLVHGILHLLGYDHVNDTDYAQMQVEENRILQHLETIP